MDKDDWQNFALFFAGLAMGYAGLASAAMFIAGFIIAALLIASAEKRKKSEP
ncbi:MAG: hypothetical protein RIC14_00635 [Filomicrobium sp.]